MKTGEVGGRQPSARPSCGRFFRCSSEPDRPQAVKADALARPLRAVGLDDLTPPLFWGSPSRQRRILGAHSAPNPDRYVCTKHVLAKAATTRALERKTVEKLRADRAARAHEDARNRRDAMRA
jgi:hypothetical protein